MLQDELDDYQGIKPVVLNTVCQEASIIVKQKCNTLGMPFKQIDIIKNLSLWYFFVWNIGICMKLITDAFIDN
jgi:hypothetical protein